MSSKSPKQDWYNRLTEKVEEILFLLTMPFVYIAAFFILVGRTWRQFRQNCGVTTRHERDVEACSTLPSNQTLLRASIEGGDGSLLPLGELDPDALDAFGVSPLLQAVQRGRRGTVRVLLDEGANTEIRLPATGETALIVATKRGDADTVLLLLQAGAKVNAYGYSGMTALMYAACSGSCAIARILLEYGADADLTLRRGRSARDYALRSRRSGIATLLAPIPASVP